MITALLIMAAEPMTAIDAERAFAADAQKVGQWAAFRKYATDDAVMFVPERVNAQTWLKDKKDPPVSVFWWPGRSYVSCDGTVAVNTGPWVRQWGKSVGYFTTVWKRQPDGSWKWIYDAGDELKVARAEGGDIKPRHASCDGNPTMMPHSGHSNDRTLAWNYNVGPQGQRSMLVWIWNGAAYENVIEGSGRGAAQMIELFTTAFITLLVIIDPPGCAPIFASLTRGTAAAERRRMAIRSAGVAWSILMFFALLGEPLLRTLGISLSAFRLAGGIMLFMIALDMVFERRTERREERAKEIEGTPEAEDISVFPMAIPMIAGPGSIASIMLLSARAEGTIEGLTVLAAMTAVILLTLLALLAAGPLMKLIGAKLEAMITRILGVILAALAVQFVLDGLERSLPGLAG